MQAFGSILPPFCHFFPIRFPTGPLFWLHPRHDGQRHPRDGDAIQSQQKKPLHPGVPSFPTVHSPPSPRRTTCKKGGEPGQTTARARRLVPVSVDARPLSRKKQDLLQFSYGCKRCFSLPQAGIRRPIPRSRRWSPSRRSWSRRSPGYQERRSSHLHGWRNH